MSTSLINAQTADTQAALNPEAIIGILKEGNQRFLESKQIGRALPEQVAATATGQYPFAAVLGCIDSRVPAETVFDLGIGDIFNIRVAGNFANTDILGSMEFAAKVAGSKVILVLGHTHCGAVKGACDHVELGNLTSMLENIMPAVNSVEESGERSSKNKTFVQNVAVKNVQLTIEKILKDSDVLREMVDNGELAIAGAMYDVETGRVDFM